MIFCIDTAILVPLQDFQKEMNDLKEQLLSFRELVQAISDFNTGKATAADLAAITYRDRQDVGQRDIDPRSKTLKLPRYSQRSTVSASSSEPVPVYSGVESTLYNIFPINVYTKAVDWLLHKEPVKKYIFYQVMARIYTIAPPSKPDWETVMTEYLDYILSIRMQAHMGKAGGNANKLHFGRFPLPDAVMTIAKENISSLHRDRVPGDKDYATFFRTKCNGIKRNHLLNAAYVVKSESKQEMAQKLLWEKYDFYTQNKVTSLHLCRQITTC